MCRFSFEADGMIHHRALFCSSSADKLFSDAQAYCLNAGVRLVAIEPCVIAISAAVRIPSSRGN